MLPVSAVEVSTKRLVVHSQPLFRPMIPFNKNAPFPSKNSVSLLGNSLYNLKLAQSIVPVPDRQYVMKNNMASNLSKLIDLNLKVRIVVVFSVVIELFQS